MKCRNPIRHNILPSCQRTPARCPQTFAMWPAIQLGYGQPIVSAFPQTDRIARASGKVEEQRKMDATRLGRKCGIETAFSRVSKSTHLKNRSARNSRQKFFGAPSKNSRNRFLVTGHRSLKNLEFAQRQLFENSTASSKSVAAETLVIQPRLLGQRLEIVVHDLTWLVAGSGGPSGVRRRSIGRSRFDGGCRWSAVHGGEGGVVSRAEVAVRGPAAVEHGVAVIPRRLAHGRAAGQGEDHHRCQCGKCSRHDSPRKRSRPRAHPLSANRGFESWRSCSPATLKFPQSVPGGSLVFIGKFILNNWDNFCRFGKLF